MASSLSFRVLNVEVLSELRAEGNGAVTPRAFVKHALARACEHLDTLGVTRPETSRPSWRERAAAAACRPVTATAQAKRTYARCHSLPTQRGAVADSENVPPAGMPAHGLRTHCRAAPWQEEAAPLGGARVRRRKSI